MYFRRRLDSTTTNDHKTATYNLFRFARRSTDEPDCMRTHACTKYGRLLSPPYGCTKG